MLIQQDGDVLVIVRQTDHMAQVARMAELWGNERFPAPEHREETIRAAGLHDNGWRIWEEQPTLVPETGRPRNFIEVEPQVHATFYRAGVEAAIAVDPYTGLLVSMHSAVLYAGVEGWDLTTLAPPASTNLGAVQRAFVDDQAAVQQRLRAALSASPRYARSVEPRRLWPAYLRLRLWDRLSLYFLAWGLGDRSLDLAPSVDGEETIQLRQTGPREATADPWPFAQDIVSFPVVVAQVADRRYASGEEFLQALVDAPQEVWRYTLRTS